jgi:hypothetical protein
VGGLTARELITLTGMPPVFLDLVLNDEVRRGHVVCDGEGMYRLAPGFAREYGAALRGVSGNKEETFTTIGGGA